MMHVKEDRFFSKLLLAVANFAENGYRGQHVRFTKTHVCSNQFFKKLLLVVASLCDIYGANILVCTVLTDL